MPYGDALGQIVVDVPGKLSAQVRVFATGNGRKIDPVDAHSVALVALRTPLGRARTDRQPAVPARSSVDPG